MDHTYLRVDPDERLPKFIRNGSDHLYATFGKTLKQTPKKRRPKGKERAAHQQAELQFRFPNEHLCVM